MVESHINAIIREGDKLILVCLMKYKMNREES